MSYIVAALAGGILLTVVMGDKQGADTTTLFLTGAFLGAGVQLTLRLTKVS